METVVDIAAGVRDQYERAIDRVNDLPEDMKRRGTQLLTEVARASKHAVDALESGTVGVVERVNDILEDVKVNLKMVGLLLSGNFFSYIFVLLFFAIKSTGASASTAYRYAVCIGMVLLAGTLYNIVRIVFKPKGRYKLVSIAIVVAAAIGSIYILPTVGL